MNSNGGHKEGNIYITILLCLLIQICYTDMTNYGYSEVNPMEFGITEFYCILHIVLA